MLTYYFSEMIKSLLELLRPSNWYKNLVVFAALVFSGNLLNANLGWASVLGFIALCAVSSANYILNDMIDSGKDRLNPEKRNRPIASGKVGFLPASLIFTALLFFGLAFAYSLGSGFFLACSSLFILSTLYSLILKNIAFADIISISLNFMVRAISGALLISVYISPWLVIGMFFFAFFLAVGKRHGELYYLKQSAGMHRASLDYYTLKLLDSLLIVSMACLVMTFALFSVLSFHKYLIFSFPLFLFAILRYYSLIVSGSPIARKPHCGIFDLQLLISSMIFAVVSLFLIYI